MSGEMPFCGESGQEQSFTHERGMPLGFQELEQACIKHGIHPDFLRLVRDERARDFVTVYGTVVDMLAVETSKDRSVIEKELRTEYGLTLFDDDVSVEHHRLW